MWLLKLQVLQRETRTACGDAAYAQIYSVLSANDAAPAKEVSRRYAQVE